MSWTARGKAPDEVKLDIGTKIPPITDEEVGAIAARLFGTVRPDWPGEIRQVVSMFIEMRS